MDKNLGVMFNSNLNVLLSTFTNQVEEIVEVGDLDPEGVHLPNVFVDRIILGRNYEKKIEVRIYRLDKQ